MKNLGKIFGKLIRGFLCAVVFLIVFGISTVVKLSSLTGIDANSFTLQNKGTETVKYEGEILREKHSISYITNEGTVDERQIIVLKPAEVAGDLPLIYIPHYEIDENTADFHQYMNHGWAVASPVFSNKYNSEVTGNEFVFNNAVFFKQKTAYEITSSRTDFYSMAGYVDYHNTFAQHHNVSAMLGAQYELKEYDYFGVSVKDIQNSLETVNGAGLVNLTDKHGTKWHEAVMSYYSRLNYNYKSKYLLEVNMRYDGSSKFKPENRWDFFYGISGGWRITEEAFMKNIKWLNDLKIRLSYGEVGNQSGIDRYDGTQFYKFESQSGAYIGPNKGTIIDTNGKIASLGREWERIKNYNLGLDFSLFNSRLTGTAEVYMKRNDNMLINVSYPGVLGDNAGMSNNGKFRSHGWEIMVNWSDKIGKDFTYHVGGTYSFNTNKLTDIGAVSVLKSGFVDKQQGYPLNSIFGLRYAGKAQTEEERQKYLYRFLTGNTIGLTEQNFRLGDNMYADVNNDGKLDQNDIVYLGTDDPKISFSFNVGAEWKGFDLSLVFQGAAKRTIFRTGDNNGNEIWRIPMKALYLNTSNQSVGNTWSPENRGAYYPTYSNKNEINDYNYQASSWSVEDGSYIRLKNVTLGYNVPAAFLAKTKAISSCRVYVAGADLWEYSKINDGWDPEASRKVSAAGRFPFVRTVTFGLNLTF